MELVTVDLSSFSVLLPVNEEFSHLGASFPGFSTVRATPQLDSRNGWAPQLDSHNPIWLVILVQESHKGFPDSL